MPAKKKPTTTGITMDPELHEELRKIAVLRANLGMGRLSVSATVKDILNTYLKPYKAKLEKKSKAAKS